MDGGSNGMLSSDPSVNPHFYNATKVHANYCDGASFASSTDYSPTVGSMQLHFRGADIFNATVASLLALGMNQAKEVILKGCSAGGLAVYLHCDIFADMLKEAGVEARVICMPDAGFFRMDVPDVSGAPRYTPEQQWVYSTQGVVQMDKGCVAAHAATNDTWRCFFAEANLPFITTPLFITQDTTDSWQMSNILGLPCNPNAKSGASVCNSTWVGVMNDFRDSMVKAYAPLLSSNTNGGFLSTCYQVRKWVLRAHCVFCAGGLVTFAPFFFFTPFYPFYPSPLFSQHCHQNIADVWGRELISNVTLHDAFWSWWSGADTLPKLLVDGAVGTNKYCFGTPYETV